MMYVFADVQNTATHLLDQYHLLWMQQCEMAASRRAMWWVRKLGIDCSACRLGIYIWQILDQEYKIRSGLHACIRQA